MKKLIFRELTILSDTTRCGGQFVLSPTINLITSKDNSSGKSSFAKALFWTLGCDPGFDVFWNSLQVKAILTLEIDGRNVVVARHQNYMWVKELEADWTFFPKITGAYAEWFSKLVGFEAVLPNRTDAAKQEVPPPAYFFLPFYVDQRKSWAYAWKSFEGLKQYAGWAKAIIGFHTGYLNKDFFKFEQQIATNKLEKKSAQLYLQKYSSVLELFSETGLQNDRFFSVDSQQIEDVVGELGSSFSSLQSKQEKIFARIANLQIQKELIVSQLEMARKASIDLEKDYKFSVENVLSDSLVCPLCGTEHDNSLVSRASILADRDSAEDLVGSLTEELDAINARLFATKENLAGIKNDIVLLQEQCTYTAAKHGIDVDASESISTVASMVFVSKSTQRKNASEKIISDVSRINKRIAQQQRDLLTKEDRDDLDGRFSRYLRSFASRLKTSGVDVALVRNPLEYKKLYGSGGAAESVRGLVAYYVSVLKMISSKSEGAVAPFVIDTPNQHEQFDSHYMAILELLVKEISPVCQLILCAMDRPDLADFKGLAKVFELDDTRLLTPEKYEDLAIAFQFMEEDYLDGSR